MRTRYKVNTNAQSYCIHPGGDSQDGNKILVTTSNLMGDTSMAGYNANASHLMIRGRRESFDQGIWLSASQLNAVNTDGNEYVSFVGPTTTGKWVRTNHNRVIKTFDVNKQRAFSGLDAGQGQVAKSDGSVQMTDNAGLRRRSKSTLSPRVGYNTERSQRYLMTPYCH